MSTTNTKNNKNVSNSDTTTDAVDSPAVEETAAETSAPQHGGDRHFVYVGPSLPNGRLKNGTVLIGSRKEITEYYKEAIELFPPVAKLFVPVAKLAESREKTQKSGNLIYKHCQEVAAAIKAKGEEE